MPSNIRDIVDTDALIDEAMVHIDDVLKKDDVVPRNGHLFSLFSYVIETALAIVAMIRLITLNLGSRVRKLETSSSISSSTSIPAARQHSAAAATSRRATGASLSKRCTNCHARGHDISDCRTVNPSAMRKRVASNSRLAKQAKASRSALSVSALLPSFLPSPYYPAPAAPPPMHFANLVADATELRRRAAQSARDRRVHHHNASS